MVIAGAQVHVAAQCLALAPHDQHHFRVRLVTDHAIHHLHARFLQPVGQVEVGFFVEACAQLDDDRHVLAIARRGNQVLDDLRVLAGAVQGLLDRQHLRVVGGSLQQVEYAAKTFVRMVQQHVALAKRLEGRLVVEFGAASLERRELQLRPVRHVIDLDDAIEVDRAIDPVNRILFEVEILQQDLDDRLRAVVGDLQTHRGLESARQQLALQRAGEVFDLLLVNEQFRVTGDAELIGALDLHPREQVVHERRENG